MKEKLIILGSGPAGLTAAIYSARADLSPLVFEGENPGGQLTQTTEVENFPGFPDGVMGAELMGKMRDQATKFGAKTVMKKVDRVDFSEVGNLRFFAGNEEFSSKSAIIATGASTRWLDLGKNEERFWGKGYSACATCDGAFFREKVVGVVGGGDSACEEADFLTKFAKKVYLIVRRDALRASHPMVARVEANPKIEILWNRQVSNLIGENLLEKVELTATGSEKVEELAVDGIFVAIGHVPNTKFLENELEIDDRGFLIAKNGFKTRVPGVFVAGDVADQKYRQAVVAAGFGCAAALEAEEFLANFQE